MVRLMMVTMITAYLGNGNGGLGRRGDDSMMFSMNDTTAL